MIGNGSFYLYLSESHWYLAMNGGWGGGGNWAVYYTSPQSLL